MNRNTIIFFIGILCLTVISCNETTQDTRKQLGSKDQSLVQSSDTAAYFYIEDNIRDFGTIRKEKQNTTTVSFEFTNTGQQPLVCIKASPSCGCMEAEIPTHPIQPGEKGEIKVKVNLRKEEGGFNKNVIIKTNAENDVTLLRIKGNVK